MLHKISMASMMMISTRLGNLNLGNYKLFIYLFIFEIAQFY